MKFVAITLPGIADICALEIKEQLKAGTEQLHPGFLMFKTDDIKAFKENTQSAFIIHRYLNHFAFSSLQDLVEKAQKVEFPISGTFAVHCRRKGSHDFVSKDVEQELGAILHERGSKVDLKSPQTIVAVEIQDNFCLLGIEEANNIWKRSYMVKKHIQGVNSCLAYAMIRLSGYQGDAPLLDPFCKDGAIIIEAAKFREGKIYGFDSLFQSLKLSEVNAKLAQVKKMIEFSRYDIEWLDVKLEKQSVGYIVTSLPYYRHDQKGCARTYKEFFHQAEYVLKKNGAVVVLCQKPELIQQDRFKVVEERSISIGDLNYKLLVMHRSTQ